MAENINRWLGTGNLTADPELRALPSGTSVCNMRIACNTRRKNGSTGEWEDKPNYFNVTVWGKQGENCAQYLAKGRPVAIDGRLDWHEWQDKDTGQKRSAVTIIADSVQFLGGRKDGEDSQDHTRGGGFQGAAAPVSADIPSGFGGVAGTSKNDDIPFLWRPVIWESAKVHVSRW
jgi:single-strand DNA-binding protein